jgi:hypothetical protein
MVHFLIHLLRHWLFQILLANIDWYAFGEPDDSESNKQLESVVIGDSLEYIPGYLFENQRNLHTVVIGDSVTEIGDNAFKGAPISSLILGASVTSIGENAFNGAPISSLILGASVTSIGEDAFNGVDGHVYILKPAQENFDIYDFSSMATVFACDSLMMRECRKVVILSMMVLVTLS